MSIVLFIFMLLVGATLQAVWPGGGALGALRPPLLLGVALYYALARRAWLWPTALLAGLLQDALGPMPLGYSMACFVGVALGAAQIVERLPVAWLARALTGAVAAGLTMSAAGLLLWSGGRIHPGFAILPARAAAAALAGAVAIPVEFRLLQWLETMLGDETETEAKAG